MHNKLQHISHLQWYKPGEEEYIQMKNKTVRNNKHYYLVFFIIHCQVIRKS